MKMTMRWQLLQEGGEKSQEATQEEEANILEIIMNIIVFNKNLIFINEMGWFFSVARREDSRLQIECTAKK
jgi:hypothetical protein